MSRLTLSRRQLLTAMGLGAAASMPVFRQGIGQAMAMDPIPKRFLGVYHPAGWRIIPREHRYYVANQALCDARVYPGRRRNADYALDSVLTPWPTETQPLQRVQQHLVFVEGLHNYANRGGNNHMAGVHTFLSGSDPTQSYQASGGPSLDYLIASQRRTQFAGINLSVGVLAGMSQSGPAQRINSVFDPQKAYEKYFVSLLQDVNVDERLEELRLRRVKRRSVLDHLSKEFKAIEPLIPAHDRPRFQANQEAIRSVERRIDALPSPGPGFTLPDVPTLDHKSNDAVPDVVDTMLDLITAGLACNIAHTATFAFGRGTLTFTPTFLGGNEHYHALSHYEMDNAAKQAQYDTLLSWTSDKVAGLVERLEAVPEADGNSLLYHSLLAWSTDNSTGWAHRVEDIPFILAGQAQGALDTGRVVSYEPGTKHNRLLLSIAQAFDLGVDAIGPAEYCEGGPLDRLFT